MAPITKFCKYAILASVLWPALSWASYQPITGSTVATGGEAYTAWPTAAGNGTFMLNANDKMGRSISVLDCPYDLQISTTVTLSGSTSETLLLSSGTTGVYNDLTSIVISNSGATPTLITLRNTGFGTTGWIHFMSPAGYTVGSTLPHVWPQQSSASDWTVQGAAGSTSIYVDAVFCQRE